MQNPRIDVRRIQYEAGEQDDVSDRVSGRTSGGVVWRWCEEEKGM
jgi:hypothetical protein